MICSNDSDFIHSNSSDLAHTKKLSGTASSSSSSSASEELHHTNTTNSSSSTNSLAFTEEDDYEISSPSPVESLPTQLSEKSVGTPSKRIQRDENEIDCIKLKLMNISKPQQSSQLFKKESSPTSRFQTYSMLRASLSNLTSAFSGSSSPQAHGVESGGSLANATSLLVSESNKNSASSAASTSSSSSSSSSSQNQNKSGDEQDKQLKQISNFQAYQQNTKYIFILNAFVNGFAQLKLCADKIDYEYIIEIYWSNEARSFVKRTFEDFVSFHRKLMLTFSDIFNELNAVCPSTNSSSFKKSITLSNTAADAAKSNQSPQKNSNSSKQNQQSKSTPVKVNLNKYGITGTNDHLVPVLPATKKPFWMSHLKLAESREIELNTYVQKLLKLPIKISHSPLVLQFFESQSSDPKPAKLHNRSSRVNSDSNNNETSELGSDNSLGNCDYDDDIDPDCSNSNGTDNENRVIDDEELDDNSNFGDEDNDDDVDLDYEMNYNRADSYADYEDEDINSSVTNNYISKISSSHLMSNISNGGAKRIHKNNCHSATIGHGCGGVSNSGVPSVSGRYRRRNNMEAGLWWDEDNALNELTTSASFDFSCSLTMNNSALCNGDPVSSQHKLNDNLNEDEDDEELETLKTLETMLKNSDLFRSSTNEPSETTAPKLAVENQLS